MGGLAVSSSLDHGVTATEVPDVAEVAFVSVTPSSEIINSNYLISSEQYWANTEIAVPGADDANTPTNFAPKLSASLTQGSAALIDDDHDYMLLGSGQPLFQSAKLLCVKSDSPDLTEIFALLAAWKLEEFCQKFDLLGIRVLGRSGKQATLIPLFDDGFRGAGDISGRNLNIWCGGRGSCISKEQYEQSEDRILTRMNEDLDFDLWNPCLAEQAYVLETLNDKFDIKNLPPDKNPAINQVALDNGIVERIVKFRIEHPGLFEYMITPADCIEQIYLDQLKNPELAVKREQLDALRLGPSDLLPLDVWHIRTKPADTAEAFYPKYSEESPDVWAELSTVLADFCTRFQETADSVDRLRYYQQSAAFDSVVSKFRELAVKAETLSSWLKGEGARALGPEVNERIWELYHMIGDNEDAFYELLTLPGHRYFGGESKPEVLLNEKLKEIFNLPETLGLEARFTNSLFGLGALFFDGVLVGSFSAPDSSTVGLAPAPIWYELDIATERLIVGGKEIVPATTDTLAKVLAEISADRQKGFTLEELQGRSDHETLFLGKFDASIDKSISGVDSLYLLVTRDSLFPETLSGNYWSLKDDHAYGYNIYWGTENYMEWASPSFYFMHWEQGFLTMYFSLVGGFKAYELRIPLLEGQDPAGSESSVKLTFMQNRDVGLRMISLPTPTR